MGRTLRAGQLIGGRFELVAQLGRGGMGEVWRAEHKALRSIVAIKFIDTETASTQEALDRFLREAQSAAALRSPHVVQILDYGVDDEQPFIVMELLEGESLARRLERVGKLTNQQTCKIMLGVARAMRRAHANGIVHRDLKPDNVFLVRNEEDEIAKVLDFGIAKSTTRVQEGPVEISTKTGAVLGTPYYMSPEQARGAKGVDHRSDLWSMGAIAYECLTGARVFQCDSLGELIYQICAAPLLVPSLRGEVPAGFDAWFAKALNRDPNERFQDAGELAEALRLILEPEAAATASKQMSDPGAARGGAEGLAFDKTSACPDAGVAAAARSADPAPAGVVIGFGSTTSAVSSTQTPDQTSKKRLSPTTLFTLVGLSAALLVAGGAIATRGFSARDTSAATTPVPVVSSPAALPSLSEQPLVPSSKPPESAAPTASAAPTTTQADAGRETRPATKNPGPARSAPTAPAVQDKKNQVNLGI